MSQQRAKMKTRNIKIKINRGGFIGYHHQHHRDIIQFDFELDPNSNNHHDRTKKCKTLDDKELGREPPKANDLKQCPRSDIYVPAAAAAGSEIGVKTELN